MSIFPKRLRPGGTVTVHCCVSPGADATEAPCVLRASILDPGGRRRKLFDRHVWIPPGFTDLRRRDLERHLPRKTRPRSGRAEPTGLATSTPLLMLGHLLGGSRDLFGALVRFTGGLHCYATYKLPRTAPLGRYRVAVDRLADGFATRSGTEELDFFMVEDLRLERTVARRGRHVARVRNPSPEPVPAHLVNILAAPNGRVRHLERTIELGPRQVTEIQLRSPTAFLFYAEYREILVLDGRRGDFCVRNPRLQWKEGGRTIHVIAADSGEGAQLDGPARLIWLRAGGFLRRDEVRTPTNRAIYDEMLRKRLILEIGQPG